MALELDLPVIALAQFNPRLKTTTIQVRGWSDLRESGSIEADGDVVIFIRSERKVAFIDSRILCRTVVEKKERTAGRV
jgi:replicative DNA helicase